MFLRQLQVELSILKIKLIAFEMKEDDQYDGSPFSNR